MCKLINFFPRFRVLFYKRWNKFFMWLLGVQYGSNLNVFNRIYIAGAGKIIIGNNFVFTSGDNINPICRNIKGSIYTMSKDARIIIGDNVGISSACIWANSQILIGNNVNIGGDCLILDNDAHPHKFLERRTDFFKNIPREKYFKIIPSAPIEICDDVWIGARCQILKGVTIGERSIIGAGSIVTNDVPADCIAAGNPCKVIKRL